MPDVSPRQQFKRRMDAGDASLRLYAILDAESCRRRGIDLFEVARSWRDAGVELVQYRNKTGDRETLLRDAERLRVILPPGEAFLLLNDRPELVPLCCFDGAHVGQGDTAANAARDFLGPGLLLGVSAHSAEQVTVADGEDVNYIAIGPVFPTSTKADAEAIVGLGGVQAARAGTRKPLVAIGGIRPAQCRDVLQAGADAVALVSGLLEGDVQQIAASLLQTLH